MYTVRATNAGFPVGCLGILKPITGILSLYAHSTRRYANAGISCRRVSVRLSVCLSVTCQYCIEKAAGSR